MGGMMAGRGPLQTEARAADSKESSWKRHIGHCLTRAQVGIGSQRNDTGGSADSDHMGLERHEAAADPVIPSPGKTTS